MSDRLRSAAAALVAQLDRVHADSCYGTIWILAQAHGITYLGPTYTDELTALRRALGASAPPASRRPLVDLDLVIAALTKALPVEVLDLVLDHLRAAIEQPTGEEPTGEELAAGSGVYVADRSTSMFAPTDAPAPARSSAASPAVAPPTGLVPSVPNGGASGQSPILRDADYEIVRRALTYYANIDPQPMRATSHIAAARALRDRLAARRAADDTADSEHDDRAVPDFRALLVRARPFVQDAIHYASEVRSPNLEMTACLQAIDAALGAHP